MLKRLIGVLPIIDEHVVQSISYKKYLPIGKPEVITENLDKWQLDEILVVCLDRTKKKLGPNFEILEKIAKVGISTPISYLGGIRNAKEAINLIQIGADRVALESLFNNQPKKAYELSDKIGKQAVIRAQSFNRSNKKFYAYDYLNKVNFDNYIIDKVINDSEYFSELLIIDKENEGVPNGFSISALKQFEKYNLQLICFGGISNGSQVKKLFNYQNVSAVAVGNFLNYKEIANREFIIPGKTEKVRFTSFGAKTRGAKEWK